MGLLTLHIEHRITEWLRDVQRSSGPTPLLNQGHLEPDAQNHVQMAFKFLEEWRLHNLSGQSVPELGHPHSEILFHDVQNLLCFSLCTYCLWSCHWLSLKRAWFCPFCTLAPGIYVSKIAPSCLFSRLNSCLSLSSYQRCSSTVMIFVALFWRLSSTSISLVLESPESWYCPTSAD